MPVPQTTLQVWKTLARKRIPFSREKQQIPNPRLPLNKQVVPKPGNPLRKRRVPNRSLCRMKQQSLKPAPLTGDFSQMGSYCAVLFLSGTSLVLLLMMRKREKARR